MIERTIVKLRATGWLVAVVLATGCAEPEMFCASGHGDFAVRYTLVRGEGACASFVGGVVGMQTYNGVKDDLPDFSRASLAVQPEYVGSQIFRAASQGLGDDNPNNRPYGLGEFSDSKPGEDDFCEAPSLTPSRTVLPEVPAVPDDPATADVNESLDVQPAIDISYTWSNMRFYVTPDSQGTQFTAELALTENGCSADYRAVGVFPAVVCSSDEECNDDTNSMNPSFAVECDTVIGLCVLSEEPPSFE